MYMYKCTECDTLYATMVAAAHCHYGIGGVDEVERDHVYVVISTAVNDPEDDSPSSEGDDPINRIEVWRDLDEANARAEELYNEVHRRVDDDEDDDDLGGYENVGTKDAEGDKLKHYEFSTGFNVYRIEVMKLPVREVLPAQPILDTFEAPTVAPGS